MADVSMVVKMAESDWFPIVVAFMSAASMAALEVTCRGMVAGHVASPVERIVRRMAAGVDGMLLGVGGWRVTWSRLLQRAHVRVGQKRATKGKRVVACGDSHSLVVTLGGKVHSFGEGSNGELGHGVASNEVMPRWIKGLDGVRVVAVAAGFYNLSFRGVDGGREGVHLGPRVLWAVGTQ